jgi:hypothetical protein
VNIIDGILKAGINKPKKLEEITKLFNAYVSTIKQLEQSIGEKKAGVIRFESILNGDLNISMITFVRKGFTSVDCYELYRNGDKICVAQDLFLALSVAVGTHLDD